MFYQLIILLTLLILSAIFSGAEVALFSIDSDKKLTNNLKAKNKLLERYIVSLLQEPKRLLVTILISNTIVNVSASMVGVILAIKISNIFNWSLPIVLTIQIILLTILILIISEITPKILATRRPVLFAKIVSFPLYWISVFIYPVSKLITDLIKSLISKIKVNRNRFVLNSTEITDLADISAEKGTIEEEEQELIYGIVEFKKITVREAMTPRVDIIAVPININHADLIKVINESGHSRIPLFENNLDNIIGIVYAKDILKYLNGESGLSDFSLTKIAREAYFVPETKLISSLMQEFQSKNIHIGIVVDEYGGTAGLISLEDILEEIVGEIRDEYDKEENEITRINENSYLVLGKVPIEEINDLLQTNFDSEKDDYDTLGGFIYNFAGQIPEENFSFEYNNHKFTVKEIIDKRINLVLIEKIPVQEKGE